MSPALRRFMPLAVVGVVAVLLVAVVAFFLVGGTPMKTISAEFSSAPGIYVGNQVDILGIPKGHIDAVTPGPDYVTVKMSVPKSLEIPANVTAELIAPEVVSDRAIQLDPPYTSGPTLPAGAVIPVSRTVIPVPVDNIIDQLNQLVTDLGPNGANKHGALTTLLQEVAKQFAGNGPNFHNTVVNLSKVFQGLAQTSPQLASLLSQLGSLSQALGDNSNTYTQFAGALNDVSGLLATDRSQIGDVLSNLQQLFANLTTFIDTNQASLGSSVVNLDAFAKALASEQTALAKVFELTPLSVQNLNNAIDMNAPGGPAIRARFNPMPDTTQAFNQICGNAVLHFLVLLATGTEKNPLTQGTPLDSICALGNALGGLTPPPHSAQGPDLTLAALVPGS